MWSGKVKRRDTYIVRKYGDRVPPNWFGISWPGDEADAYRAAYLLQTGVSLRHDSFETQDDWYDRFEGLPPRSGLE